MDPTTALRLFRELPLTKSHIERSRVIIIFSGPNTSLGLYFPLWVTVLKG